MKSDDIIARPSTDRHKQSVICIMILGPVQQQLEIECRELRLNVGD